MRPLFGLAVLITVAGTQLVIYYRYLESYYGGGIPCPQRPPWRHLIDGDPDVSTGPGLRSITYNQSVIRKLFGLNNNTQTLGNLNFLLRMRQLVHWSVRTVNLRLRGQECSRWWVNPLSLLEVRKVSVSRVVTQYILTFRIQPGHLPFRTAVNVVRFDLSQRDTDRLHDPADLTLVHARRLDNPSTECGTVPSSLIRMCLCPGESQKATEVTEAVRQKWNRTDPELHTWPVNASFMVSDYMTYGHLRDYLKLPSDPRQFCGSRNLTLVIFVSSTPSNFKGRMAIRKTYGNPEFLKQYRTKLLFGFDKITELDIEEKIHAESSHYDDIVQAGHAHSYHNLTLRDLSMFNWLLTLSRLQACKMPLWVIKIDDDYFLNVPLALRVIAQNPDVELMGSENCDSKTTRDRSEAWIKYYTPRYIVPYPKYPGYLSGAMWIVRSDIIQLLLKASLTVPLVQAEDAYVTGLLTREVGIVPRDLSAITFETETGPCKTKRWVNSRAGSPADFAYHWRQFLAPIPANCTEDLESLKAWPVSDGCFYNL